jgi:Tol biopolymer transport system component
MSGSLRLGQRLALGLLVIGLVGCSGPTPVPTETSTSTPSLTWTPTASPTSTSTPTASPTASATPTATLTPSITPTASDTPLPSATPWPTLAFGGDNWTLVEAPAPLGRPLADPWVSFVNINDRDGIGDPRTPQPGTNIETVYLVNPRTGQRVPVLNLPASTDDRVYWAPTGERVAYFLADPENPGLNGLYVLDLTIGLSSRLLKMDTLSQRGFFSPPQWSPDGRRIAVAVASEYDIDIYVMSADGTDLRVVAPSGGYDLWPLWSPDGRYLAFVSDRAECPSWRPGDGCFEAAPNGPPGGHLYVLDLESDTGEPRRISETLLTEPPVWIHSRLIGYTSGSIVLGDDFRTLWRVSIPDGQPEQVTHPERSDVAYYLAERWRPAGDRVFFQRAGQTTALALMDSTGRELASTDRFNFARFALTAAWSPDGMRIAIGGRNGQCPYGLVVLTENMEIISTANPPPTACDPVFAPDGNWIAYSGINPRIDGRLDLYVANPSGYSAVNLTADLRGQIRVLGWVGNSQP